MARLDKVKNLTGLAEWYGSNERLRGLVNLVIVGECCLAGPAHGMSNWRLFWAASRCEGMACPACPSHHATPFGCPAAPPTPQAA